MLQIFTTPEAWISLLTLTLLEVILGVDNLVFISIITARLPKAKQQTAQKIGLILACATRILFLAFVAWLTGFVHPLFTLFGHAFSVRDLILIGGGLFLLAKSTSEIHITVVPQEESKKIVQTANFSWVIIQILILDIIFSLDSIFTAVGMAREFVIMALAIVIAVGMMIWASAPLSRFIHTYPSLKMLALSFLLLVGVVLIADGLKFHIPREYVYFAIAFSILVEILNILAGRRRSKK